MPLYERETPSYSSSRVQRAFRINSIEQHRLRCRLQLLDKEKVHNIRVANQDIRLISLTLDYIQSCSGHSPEAMEPVPENERAPTPKAKEKEFFMYGERVVSRKVSRFRRPQSAVERCSQQDSRRGSLSTGGEQTPCTPRRPQSSPVKRGGSLPTWTHSSGDDTDPSVCSDVDSDRGTVVSYVWTDEPSEMTKKIFRAQELRNRKRSIVYSREPNQRTSGALNMRSLSRQLRAIDGSASPPSGHTSHRSIESVPARPGDLRSRPTSASPVRSRQNSARLGRTRPPSTGPGRTRQMSADPERTRQMSEDSGGTRQPSAGPGKGAGLSELLSQRRPTLSASAWRNHIAKNRSAPMSAESRRQQLTDMKLRLNENRQKHVQTRLNNFLQEYPVKRSTAEA